MVKSASWFEPVSGSRDAETTQIRDTYLQNGRVPVAAAVRLGTTSLIRDPWLMVVRHLPGPVGFALRRRYYRRRLGTMGRGTLIDPGVFILDPQNVYLGDFCYLGTGAQLVAPQGYIRIGRRCHVTGRILGHGEVEIGDYVGMAGTVLSVTESHQGGFRMAGPMLPAQQRRLRYGKVTIENDAFLAIGSVVMPGVTIGRGAVVGPNSLVVSNVAPWSVVLGTPARVVAQREPVRLPDPDPKGELMPD